MANLRMMHAMSRHYSLPVRLAVLLQKIARQVRRTRQPSACKMRDRSQRGPTPLLACARSEDAMDVAVFRFTIGT